MYAVALHEGEAEGEGDGGGSAVAHKRQGDPCNGGDPKIHSNVHKGLEEDDGGHPSGKDHPELIGGGPGVPDQAPHEDGEQEDHKEAAHRTECTDEGRKDEVALLYGEGGQDCRAIGPCAKEAARTKSSMVCSTSSLLRARGRNELIGALIALGATNSG